MEILIDETKKELVLIKKDGTEISRYTYRKAIKGDFTFEKLKNDLEKFNKTLKLQPEFDDIKDLANAIKIHDFD